MDSLTKVVVIAGVGAGAFFGYRWYQKSRLAVAPPAPTAVQAPTSGYTNGGTGSGSPTSFLEKLANGTSQVAGLVNDGKNLWNTLFK